MTAFNQPLLRCQPIQLIARGIFTSKVDQGSKILSWGAAPQRFWRALRGKDLRVQLLVSVLVQRSERRITKANSLLPSGVHDPANTRLDAETVLGTIWSHWYSLATAGGQ